MQFKLDNIRPSNHATIKGNFDVLIPDLNLKIKECRLVKSGTADYFIGFPSHKDNNGVWKNDVLWTEKDSPKSKELIDLAVEQVLRAGVRM
jgi:hypothetical protein